MTKKTVRALLLANLVLLALLGGRFLLGKRSERSETERYIAEVDAEFAQRGVVAKGELSRLVEVMDHAARTREMPESDFAWTLTMIRRTFADHGVWDAPVRGFASKALSKVASFTPSQSQRLRQLASELALRKDEFGGDSMKELALNIYSKIGDTEALRRFGNDPDPGLRSFALRLLRKADPARRGS